jgi:hypothetical protein
MHQLHPHSRAYQQNYDTGNFSDYVLEARSHFKTLFIQNCHSDRSEKSSFSNTRPFVNAQADK